MSLISEDLAGNKINKVKQSIDRLKTFEPAEGYFLAFSGGKDSIVIKALADMAGVKYDAHYHVTTVDPPELTHFIRDYHSDVILDKPKTSMRKLIINNRFPPTRMQRYCCKELKEINGVGRVVITGARWAESAKRKKNQGMVTIFDGGKASCSAGEQGAEYSFNQHGGIIMNEDNDAERRTVELCYRTNKTIINPIIDWSDDDVWQFIREYNIPYCKLYDEGWKRIGCIGCPLAGKKNMRLQFERWPTYYKLYLHAFDDMLKKHPGETKWNSAHEVMDWWLRENPKIKKIDGQESFL